MPTLKQIVKWIIRLLANEAARELIRWAWELFKQFLEEYGIPS